MCTKLKFATRRDAKAYLKRRRNNNGLRAKHVYACHHCGYWHMTSQTARPR